MDKQETKNKLFFAAANLFATKGYYHVSVREICNTAGVSKPVLYYYFKDKEDLLQDLVIEIYSCSKRLFDKYMSPGSSLEENINGLYKVYLTLAEDYPYLIRLSALVQLTPLPKKIKIINKQRSDELIKYITGMFQRAKGEGIFPADINTDMLTLSLIAPIGILVAQNVLFNDTKILLNKSLKMYFDFWKSRFIKHPEAE